MKCPNCGKEVLGNFCTNCGTRMDRAAQGTSQPRDPGATAVIRPEDMREVEARQQSAQPRGDDSGATMMAQPGDFPWDSGQTLTGAPGSQPYGTPPGSQPYGGPGGPPPYGAPGGQQPYGPQGQQPYGAPPGSQPYGAPGQQPYGGPGPGQQYQESYGNSPPGPGSSNWASQLGLGQGAQRGPMGGPVGAGQQPLFGFQTPAGVQQTLAPLEQAGKQIIAWIGSVLLLIGLFLPAKTVSYSGIITVSGSGSLWDYGTFWAVVLLLLAVASAALAYLRDYKWLLITGGAALVILVVQFLYAFSSNGVSLEGLSVHPSWGWIILFPAALLILAAGAMRANPRDAVNDQALMSLIGGVRSNVGGRR
ncbi:MAG: hypothetical protein JOZ41_13765 [Chloroflexi bacterium]|nr:hypothetical protein [Chloroflexota bacterium]